MLSRAVLSICKSVVDVAVILSRVSDATLKMCDEGLTRIWRYTLVVVTSRIISRIRISLPLLCITANMSLQSALFAHRIGNLLQA